MKDHIVILYVIVGFLAVVALREHFSRTGAPDYSLHVAGHGWVYVLNKANGNVKVYFPHDGQVISVDYSTGELHRAKVNDIEKDIEEFMRQFPEDKDAKK